MQFVPDFARSWQVSPDGKVWTFHTQPNAKWSDGKPLTAPDAAWTYSTILKFQNGPTANSAGYVAHMKSATAPNADHPGADLQAAGGQRALAGPAGADPARAHLGQVRHRQRQGADDVQQQRADRLRRAVHPEKYTPKQIALFKRNPDFYGPRPHIDGFGLQFFDTTDAMVTALKSDQLDGVEFVPPTSVATLKAANFVVPTVPSYAFDDFIINSNPQQQASHKELLNPLLRQAFDSAIDRQAIVKTSLLGYGQPGSYDHPARHRPVVTTRRSSRRRSASPGRTSCSTRPGTRWARTACGSPTATRCRTPSSCRATSRTTMASGPFQIIQSDFTKIGVQLTEKVLDDSAAYNAITANNYKNFEMSMWDWFPLPDPDFMLSVLTCGSCNVWNDTGYCSKAYDGLYQRSRARR